MFVVELQIMAISSARAACMSGCEISIAVRSSILTSILLNACLCGINGCVQIVLCCVCV